MQCSSSRRLVGLLNYTQADVSLKHVCVSVTAPDTQDSADKQDQWGGTDAETKQDGGSHLRLLMHTKAKQRPRSQLSVSIVSLVEGKKIRDMLQVGDNFTHLASNNTTPHQNLSWHAYEASAHFGLSTSSSFSIKLQHHFRPEKLCFIARLAVNPGCNASVEFTGRNGQWMFF